MKLKEILARVERRLAKTGQTANGASRAAGKPDAIRNLRRAVKQGRDGMTTGTISVLAPVLKTSAAWLLEEQGQEDVTETPSQDETFVNPPRKGEKPSRHTIKAEQTEQIPGAQLVGERDLPVFGTSQGGKGAVIVSNDPVDWVARPDPLARVKDGYGIIVPDDTMFPALETGDTLLVNPHLPPKEGNTCIFRSRQPDDTVHLRINFLRRQTTDSWHVTEWNSDGKRTPRDFSLKKSEWQICHVSVGKYNA